MLQLRPNCECCDRDLPPDSTAARICTYECTFCADCVDELLQNVCPNCGGGFTPRPVRPQVERRTGISLAAQPPSTERVHSPYTREQIVNFSAEVKHIPPEAR